MRPLAGQRSATAEQPCSHADSPHPVQAGMLHQQLAAAAQQAARVAAALAASAVLALGSAAPPAEAVLNNPRAPVPRSADVALRRSIPAFNQDVREVQTRLEVRTRLLGSLRMHQLCCCLVATLGGVRLGKHEAAPACQQRHEMRACGLQLIPRQLGSWPASAARPHRHHQSAPPTPFTHAHDPTRVHLFCCRQSASSCASHSASPGRRWPTMRRRQRRWSPTARAC